MKNLKLSLLVSLITLTLASKAQSITYIANAGVLIENKKQKVLIDAIFGQDNLKFDAPEPSTIQDITQGIYPFDSTNLLLITHVHQEHFDPLMVSDYLKNNKTSKLISSGQVLDSLKSFADISPETAARVTTYPWRKGWRQVQLNGITVKSAYTLHGGKKNAKIQNLMHLIEIGDKKVLHVGDTQMELDQFKNMRIIYEDVDVAIVPFWYLTNHYGAELLKDYVNAKQYIGVRYPTKGSPESLEKIKGLFPTATVFIEKGHTVSF